MKSGANTRKNSLGNAFQRRGAAFDALAERSKRNYSSSERLNLVRNQPGGVFMNTNFRWFTVAVLSAVAVLPVRAQVQVQNTNVRGGNGVNYVRAARPAPPRSFSGPSFRPAPIRRPMFKAARIQNINGAQPVGSIDPRLTFQQPQHLVAPNLGNQQSATASGTLSLNLATNRVASSDPAPQGTSSNKQLPQANNSSHAAGSARNHVF